MTTDATAPPASNLPAAVPRPLANVGLYGYLTFVVSWFLHVPERIPLLGTLRIDLMLVIALAWIAWVLRARRNPASTAVDRRLRLLIGFAVLMIPFAEWPGSVVKTGIPDLIKAMVFYYFTVAFVRTEADLKKFLVTFIGCQCLRVLEPLYLHVTSGYWGSAASELAGQEFLNRLSGSPDDVVNPNGLAYVCCTALLFLFFFRRTGRRQFWAFLLLAPACLYALTLTGSRSGMLALLVMIGGIVLKSRRPYATVAVALAAALTAFTFLTPDMQDRYLSIVGVGAKNDATAEERFAGLRAQWDVARPRFFTGYGLGTSPEANFHYTASGPYVGKAIPAHNLYLEVLEELGIFGLLIFLSLMVTVVRSFFKAIPRARAANAPDRLFMARLVDTMQIWLAMDILCSFASYGLSSYEWYLFAGLSVVVQRMQAPAASTGTRG